MSDEVAKLKADLDAMKDKPIEIKTEGATKVVPMAGEQVAIDTTISQPAAPIKAKKEKKLFSIDKIGLAPVALTIIIGMIAGALAFRAGTAVITLAATGGVLITGLVIGHFGKMGRLDLKINETTAKIVREMGLVIFLSAVGLMGGLNFVYVIAGQPELIAYGAVMTLSPMVVAFLIGRYVFKLGILNNLGSVTGSMTSTPGLGALIHASKTEEVGHAYAAAYPIALFSLIFVPMIVSLIF